MIAPTSTHFDQQYQAHLKHLKLKSLQPKTIEACARAIRHTGEYFDHQIDNLTEPQPADYFSELIDSHSWSSVKLDLYGLKFYYVQVQRKSWVAPGLIKLPRSQRLPDAQGLALELPGHVLGQLDPRGRPFSRIRSSSRAAA